MSQENLLVYSGGMRGEERAGREERQKKRRGAHLTVAIRREDYSITLTKCFKNTVKLKERKGRKRDMKGREKFRKQQRKTRREAATIKNFY